MSCFPIFVINFVKVIIRVKIRWIPVGNIDYSNGQRNKTHQGSKCWQRNIIRIWNYKDNKTEYTDLTWGSNKVNTMVNTRTPGPEPVLFLFIEETYLRVTLGDFTIKYSIKKKNLKFSWEGNLENLERRRKIDKVDTKFAVGKIIRVIWVT